MKMQHSVYCHPQGGRRKQTIGIILSLGKGRREYGVREMRLPYLLAKFFLEGIEFATPLISRLPVPAQQQVCRDTKCTSGSASGG